MIYENYTQKAVFELEKQRCSDDFDNYFQSSDCKDICCECKMDNDFLYEIDGSLYCKDCICQIIRDTVADFPNNSDNIDVYSLVNDIISDFSDNELISYINERYNRIC